MLRSHSTSTGLYGLGSQLRQAVPHAVTMPQHFANSGYRTESLGKVFHVGHGNEGDPQSFQLLHFADKVIEYLDPESTDGGQLTREEAYFTNQRLGDISSLPRGAAFESTDATDVSYADGRVAMETIKRLRAAHKRRERDGTEWHCQSLAGAQVGLGLSRMFVYLPKLEEVQVHRPPWRCYLCPPWFHWP